MSSSKRVKHNNGTCSIKELKMLGDHWTLAIIQSLRDEKKRFAQLMRDLEVNPTTLSNRLKKLEEQNIIKRQEETVDKLSVVYSLTKKGEGVLPILHEIRQFADRFLK